MSVAKLSKRDEIDLRAAGWRDCTRCGGFDRAARHWIGGHDSHHYDCCDPGCASLVVGAMLSDAAGGIGLAGSG